MTEWHTVSDRNDLYIVTPGYQAEDGQDTTGYALVADHGDQCVIEGDPDTLAAQLRAAADLLTRPDRDRWSIRPVAAAAHDTLAAQHAARAQAVTAAHRAARLLADTLTAHLPNAAYLVLGFDDDSCHNQRLIPDRLCDPDGHAIHRFTHTGRLPDRSTGHPLHQQLLTAWRDLDPADPRTLTRIIRALATAGEFADRMPCDLPGLDPDEDFGDLPVMALVPAARLDRPGLAADLPQLLRPHRPTAPAPPTAPAVDPTNRSSPPPPANTSPNPPCPPR
jgi:hypothetical protein